MSAAEERLIVFTRYPEPGKTKTRLIPALGAQRAAILHSQLTEHTLAWVRQLEARCPVFVEVRYTGGSKQLMENWLGADLHYRRQGPGDLGKRMGRAFDNAFADGMKRAVIVGTDCPGLNADIVQQALTALQRKRNDVVLGPAEDGGYYLIGLRYAVPQLFNGLPWGTGKVLEMSMRIAGSLGLSVVSLNPLEDVDRPEDLPVWEKQASLLFD